MSESNMSSQFDFRVSLYRKVRRYITEKNFQKEACQPAKRIPVPAAYLLANRKR